jgi:hypothetical protein
VLSRVPEPHAPRRAPKIQIPNPDVTLQVVPPVPPGPPGPPVYLQIFRSITAKLFTALFTAAAKISSPAFTRLHLLITPCVRSAFIRTCVIERVIQHIQPSPSSCPVDFRGVISGFWLISGKWWSTKLICT